MSSPMWGQGTEDRIKSGLEILLYEYETACSGQTHSTGKETLLTPLGKPD